MNTNRADMIEATLQPIDKARGLPSYLYVDDTASAAEREHLFFKTWSALTHAKNVPDIGSVFPIDFLGRPFLVTRGKRGVKVFENVCRHRGMRLVSAAGKLKGPITCPYHAWAYDFDGVLSATPHVGGAGVHHHASLDSSEMGLLEVRSHVWRDVVFINVDGREAPFEEVHSELLSRWQEFEQPLYHVGYEGGGDDSSFSLSLASNWKLAVDNYCESYHLPFVHPDLNSYSRIEDHYNIVGLGGFAGQGTWVYNPSLSDDGRVFPDFAGLSDKWSQAAEYVALFPNVLLGVHRDHAFSIVLVPDGCGRVDEHVELYYSSSECLGAEYSDLRKRNKELWHVVFEEDIGVVEGMYLGRCASGYDGGRFSPVMEESTYRFHHWVAERMRDGV